MPCKALLATSYLPPIAKILHRLGLTIAYETVNSALKLNADASLANIREVVLNRRFFVSFDNMTFHRGRGISVGTTIHTKETTPQATSV